MPPVYEWYFAYGSNLDPATFCGRRRMQPRAIRRAVLRDFELTFDLPVGPSNRGVANLVPASGKKVWGAVYQIAQSSGRQLDRSEGVQRDYYRRTAVSIDLDDDQQIDAFTYTSKRSRSGRLPSARYLGLIVNGAIYHQLPAPWIDSLRAWSLAIDKRHQRQGELF